MTCENFNPSNPELPNQLAQIVLDGIVGAIAKARLPQIKRAYVGVGPVPAEDCCPDIVVWITNIRLWDGSAPDTLVENRVLDHYGVAFDINARVGDCFWELTPTEKPRPETPLKITKMSAPINSYAFASYLGAVNTLTALPCDISVHPQPANPYQDGGCAGFQFVIGVGVI